MRSPNLKRYLPLAGLIVMLGLGVWLLNEPAPTQPAPASAADFGTSGADLFWLLVKTVFILAAVCGLAWLSLRWLLPRLYGAPPGSTRHIQVLETHRLDPHRSLLLVRVGEEVFLLAAADRGLQFLSRIERGLPEETASPPEPAPPDRKPPSAFEALLRK